MPELPEIETIVRSIKQHRIKLTIIIVSILVIMSALVFYKKTNSSFVRNNNIGCVKENNECFRCKKTGNISSGGCFNELECKEVCPRLLKTKCWSDFDCQDQKVDSTGKCVNPETNMAECVYTQVDPETKCIPLTNNGDNGLKIVFIPNKIDKNLLNNFEKEVENHISQFYKVEPFKTYKGKMVFYFMETSTDFGFDNDHPAYLALDNAVKKYCGDIDEKIIVLDRVQRGGAPIYGILNGHLAVTLIDDPWTTLHEFAHSFGGLQDNYVGWMLYDGNPVIASTDVPNADVAGCSKWCASFKPKYSTGCTLITDENTCRHFQRASENLEGGEKWSCNDPYKCCVWLEEPDPYFKTNCVNFRGNVNIGEDCYGNTGCYFGSNGQGAWRPVLDEGIMANDKRTDFYFDPVSRRALEEKLKKY